MDNLYICDFEVFAFDWLVIFKNVMTKEYTVIHNDNDEVTAFMELNPLLAWFNGKHYDQFILKAVLLGYSPEQIKEINDAIIVDGVNGWQIPMLRTPEANRIYFNQYDLMDDTQDGMSLKVIEAHMGMDIRETTVSFDIDRPLTDAEIDEVVFYCKHDVDATEKLNDLRKDYIGNKLALAAVKGIDPMKALYMTNAKLTAAYLDAKPPDEPWTDERAYQYPDNILWEYIPQEVNDFFNQIYDKSIPDNVLFSQKHKFMLDRCEVTMAWGGIHGAIPCYTEEATDTRTIRNKDVASYYPNLMRVEGYCSRNMPDPQLYADTIQRRVTAKRAGDKATANALKLVLNTTYGAMLSPFNDLYDPLMGRSVCITGQLRLLELACHCMAECPSLKIIQLNTDGIMVSLDNVDEPKWQEITQEWQDRTGFELEEDFIRKIVQKDVNNYVEVPMEGEPKIKGGVLVRGIPQAGAFKINNDAVIVAKAVADNLAYGTPVEETVYGSNNIFDFQLAAKSWAKCGNALYDYDGKLTEVQRVNRVYASTDYRAGTLYMLDPNTGNNRKISGLPAWCVVDNDNHLTIDAVDRDWYIRLAKRYVNDFLGIKTRRNGAVTRRINKIKKELLEVFQQ